MPDTGAPWNIPYVAGSDLVRDWPAASQAVAEAVADGLDEAGGLVAVKTVIKTDTASFGGVAGGAAQAVTGFTISHAVADAANKVVLFAQVSGGRQRGSLAAAFTAGGTAISIGDAEGSRTRVSGHNRLDADAYFSTLTLMTVYTPGDTSSVTYGVNLYNLDTSSDTIYLNRPYGDANTVQYSRGASVMTLMEIKV